MLAVNSRARKRAALTQWRARSTPSKRITRPAGASAGGVVVAAIGLPDKGIHVVAPDLPVAPGRIGVRDLDGLQPLAGLVAVHGRHVHAHGAAVGGRDGLALHLVCRLLLEKKNSTI